MPEPPHFPLDVFRSDAGDPARLVRRAVEVRELGAEGLLEIVHAPGCDDVRESAGAVLGLELPAAPNTAVEAAGDEPVYALWTGPRRWLIRCSDADAAGLAERLNASLEARGGAAAVLSDGQAGLTVEGPEAESLLAIGTPLALSPGRFALGTCARTVLAKISVLLHRRGLERFDLFVERSRARYLWTWCQTVMREFEP